MEVILTIGYDKYVLGIEDAAKVMRILGEAQAVTYRCANEDEGTFDRWVVVRNNLEIAPATLPIASR